MAEVGPAGFPAAANTVVVHYAVEGSEQAASEIDLIGGAGLEMTEGVVTRIDRGLDRSPCDTTTARPKSFD